MSLAAPPLPTPLASALAHLEAETSPFRRVHRLFDATEVLVKLTASALLVHLVRAPRGVPEQLRLVLARSLRTPTLGTWWSLAREGARMAAASGAAPPAPGLVDFVLGAPGEPQGPCLLTLLDGDGSLLALRNAYAHGGTVTTDAACLDDATRGRERLLATIERAGWLRACLLLAVEPTGEAWHGAGASPAPCVAPPGLGPGVHLVGPGGCHSMRLDPLLVWDPSARGFYFFNAYRRDEVVYTACSGGERLKGGARGTAFEATFPLRTWAQSAGDEAIERIAALTETFVGRERELERIVDTALGVERGFLFVWGGPGVGKSSLLARACQVLRDSHGEQVSVVEWFVRRGRGGAERAEAVLEGLRTGLDRCFQSQAPPGRRREELARGLLQQLRSFPKVRPAPARLVVVVDGLDEGVDSELLAYLPREVPERVCVVYSSRNREEVQRFYHELDRENRRALDLVGLNHAEARALLSEYVDKYVLEDGYVDAAVLRSQGNPLYLKLLCEALDRGELTLNDEGRLPQGIEDMYAEIVKRHARAPRVFELFMLLAVAAEYLTVDTLSSILGWSPLEVEEVVGQALEVLVDDPRTPARDYQLFHESLREYLRRSYARPASDQERRLAAWCGRWRIHVADSRTPAESALVRYALRHLVRHLVAVGRHDDAARTVRDRTFVQQQVGCFGSWAPPCDDLRLLLVAVCEERGRSTEAVALSRLALEVAERARAAIGEGLALAQRGSWTQAIERVRLLGDEGERFLGVAAVASIAVQRRDVAGAEAALAALGDVEASAYDWRDWLAPSALLELIARLSDLGVPGVERLVSSDRDPSALVTELVDRAALTRRASRKQGTGRTPSGRHAAVEQGRLTGSGVYLGLAIGVAAAITRSARRADALTAVARALGGEPGEVAGHLAGRLTEAAAQIRSPEARLRALVEIGRAATQAGAEAQARVALAQAGALAPACADPELLGDLAAARASAGEEPEAAALLTRVEAALAAEPDALRASSGLLALARARGGQDTGPLEAALARVPQIGWADARAGVLQRVATSTASPELLSRAAAHARDIAFGGARASALGALAAAVDRSGQSQEAHGLFTEAMSAAGEVGLLELRAAGLLEIAQAQAAGRVTSRTTDALDAALDAAAEVPDARRRDEACERVLAGAAHLASSDELQRLARRTLEHQGLGPRTLARAAALAPSFGAEARPLLERATRAAAASAVQAAVPWTGIAAAHAALGDATSSAQAYARALSPPPRPTDPRDAALALSALARAETDPARVEALLVAAHEHASRAEGAGLLATIEVAERVREAEVRARLLESTRVTAANLPIEARATAWIAIAGALVQQPAQSASRAVVGRLLQDASDLDGFERRGRAVGAVAAVIGGWHPEADVAAAKLLTALGPAGLALALAPVTREWSDRSIAPEALNELVTASAASPPAARAALLGELVPLFRRGGRLAEVGAEISRSVVDGELVELLLRAAQLVRGWPVERRAELGAGLHDAAHALPAALRARALAAIAAILGPAPRLPQVMAQALAELERTPEDERGPVLVDLAEALAGAAVGPGVLDLAVRIGREALLTLDLADRARILLVLGGSPWPGRTARLEAAAAAVRAVPSPGPRAHALVQLATAYHAAGDTTRSATALAEGRAAACEVDWPDGAVRAAAAVGAAALDLGSADAARAALAVILEVSSRADGARAKAACLLEGMALLRRLGSEPALLATLLQALERLDGPGADSARTSVLAGVAAACGDLVDHVKAGELLRSVIEAAAPLRGRGPALQAAIGAAQALADPTVSIQVLAAVIGALRELEPVAREPLAALVARAAVELGEEAAVLERARDVSEPGVRRAVLLSMADALSSRASGERRVGSVLRLLAIDPFEASSADGVALALLRALVAEGDVERAWEVLAALGVRPPVPPPRAAAVAPPSFAGGLPATGTPQLAEGPLPSASERLCGALETGQDPAEVALRLVDVARVDGRRFSALLASAVATVSPDRLGLALDELALQLRRAGLDDARRRVVDAQRDLERDVRGSG